MGWLLLAIGISFIITLKKQWKVSKKEKRVMDIFVIVVLLVMSLFLFATPILPHPVSK